MSGSVVASQLGARMHYAVPRVLHAAGRLERFYTDICMSSGWPRAFHAVPKRLRPAFLRRLLGRAPVGVPAERLVAFHGFGLEFAVRRWAARTPRDETAAALWGGRRFSELVTARGFGKASGFFGYNGECLEQLKSARVAGLWRVVEQTIAPRTIVDRLLAEEHDRFPDWQAPPAANSFAAAFASRERAEWEAADLVVCGSEFVRQGLVENGVVAGRCRVVPYGIDARFRIVSRRPHEGPLRVLTIGEVGLRKGSPYVVEAARRLQGKAVFRMVGPVNVLPEIRRRIVADAEIAGPVPRAEIVRQFEWADVFLLPSICEGSATAVYEALAAGLPVICTPNTGSVVRHGEDGFIVPIRDPTAIVDAIDALSSPPRRRAMGRNAAQRAAEFTLDAYARRLLAALPSAGAAVGEPAPRKRYA